MRAISESFNLADTQIIEVTAADTDIITDEELRILQNTAHEKIMKLEAYARMQKDERWESMQDFSEEEWKEYEAAMEFCDDEKRKMFFMKMIRGNRSRQRQLIRMGCAMSC